MSLNTTDISNGVFISASNGNNTRVKFTNAGTYNIQFSSQFSNTDNSNQDVVIWIRKNGTDIPDSSGTAAVPPFKAGSNGQIIASWNYYLSLAANDFIQLCWHVEQANVITLETIAAGTSPTHPRTPSTILTAQRVDTFLSNTGSFSGSFTGILTGTASYATQALSASFAPSTPAFPFTGSAIITGSLNVIGNTTMTGSFNVSGSVRLNGNAGVTIIGNTTVTGSLTVSSSIGVTGSINVKRTTAGSCGIFENNSYNLGGGPPILVKDGLNSLGLGYGSATAYFYTPNDGLYIHGYGNYGTFFETGNVVIPNKLQVGSTNTTTGAKIHIAAGTATALTAPIKLTAGTNMTTPEAGAVEFNGTNLFFTTGSTRSTILTNTNPASISGNLILTGSLLVSGSVRLNGNAGVNITGNTVITGSLGVTGGITGSLQGTASYATQALSASYAPSAGGVAFPFTGSAIITGSLNVIGNTAITGSLVAGYNPTPLEGTIQDGVTSVLGDLNNWNSDFYQGTVLYSETAGGTIGFGQLCYRTMFETWELADATVASETSFNMLGICVRHSVSGSATSILINGFVETTYVTIGKSGEPLYMDTTSGSINATPPTSVGNVVRLIGNTFWTSNTNAKIIIHFNPDRSWIEL